MNRHGIATKRISLLSVAFLLAITIGCAPVQTKSTGEQAETTSISEGQTEMREGITQEYLQLKLMGFADTFATKYADAISILLEQESSAERVLAARSKFYMAASAIDIASSRYPRVALVDMVVLVTLGRIVWEEYAPEVFGDSALMVVKTLRNSEEDIWALAAKVLTPEQLKELRALIYKWREKNPGRQPVSFIRFNNLVELMGKDSLLQKETKPGGLFAPVTEATRAVDEIRLTAERALYRLSRMQTNLGLQIEMVYHDLATGREIRQLLSDITGFREVVERLPAQISEERKSIMRDLESHEKTIQNVIGDIRQTMSEGNDLISLVNETTKTVDYTASRIDSMLRNPETGRPFDIMNYYNTVLLASDAVKQANSLLDSVEELLASPKWEQQMPVVLKLADAVESEGEELVTHAFVLGIALIIIFSLAMLVLIRYAARQFAGLRKERGTA